MLNQKHLKLPDLNLERRDPQLLRYMYVKFLNDIFFCSSEVHETVHAAPPSPDFASTTKTDYHRGTRILASSINIA